jgi:hypothetical protein
MMTLLSVGFSVQSPKAMGVDHDTTKMKGHTSLVKLECHTRSPHKWKALSFRQIMEIGGDFSIGHAGSIGETMKGSQALEGREEIDIRRLI